MPTVTAPAIDPTLSGPQSIAVEASTVGEQFPPVVDPGPGDPDVEWEPVQAAEGRRVQVVIGRAITRQVVGEFASAVVDEWGEDVDLLAGPTCSFTVSGSDPLWSVLGATSIGADGTAKAPVDMKPYICWVHVDGVAVWTGVFRAPVNVGGGRVRLVASSPAEVFSERILGRAEQFDLLGDRGSFEGPNPLAGWAIPDGVTADIVTDGVRGTKALRVIGAGWVGSPKVTVQGAAGYGRSIEGAAFGKFAANVPDGTPVVRTWVQRTGQLVPTNQAVTLERAGVTVEGTGWSDDPIASGARMDPQAVPHRAWVEVRSFPGVHAYYDLVTLRQGILTGFPPSTKRDLADYVVRTHRDLVSRKLGGSPTGLTTRIVSRTGTLAEMRWAHNQRTSFRDVLTMILDAEGGPECRITPGWVLEVHRKLGAIRTDVVLTDDVVAGVEWTVDPGAQVDDFVADTGRGSGTSWLAATVSQDDDDARHRITSIVQAPPDRTLNEVTAWARAHASAAARLQVVADVSVPWGYGAQIATGDAIAVRMSDGDLALDGVFRVVRRTFRPGDDLISLQLGLADA